MSNNINKKNKSINDKKTSIIAIFAFFFIPLGPLLFSLVNYYNILTKYMTFSEYFTLITPFVGIVVLIDISKEHKDNKVVNSLINGIKLTIILVFILLVIGIINFVVSCSALA